jgi:hypothetical protein
MLRQTECLAHEGVIEGPVPTGPQARIMGGQKKTHRCRIGILDGIEASPVSVA